MKKFHHRPGRSGSRGIALIDALVSVLIFAFGIVGLIGVQAAMTRAQGAAKFRADATGLASQVLGTMWADRTNLAKYNGAACANYQPCKDWQDKAAAALPGGTAAVASDNTGSVTVTLTWSTAAEGTHKYVLNTSIN